MDVSGDRGSLSPLPENHRMGLIVLTGFSFLSFLSTSVLWTFITYKIVSVRVRSYREARREARDGGDGTVEAQAEEEAPDLTMGLAMDAYGGGKAADISVLDELAKKRDAEFQRREQQRQQQQQQQQQQRRTPRKTLRARVAEALSKKANPFPILVYHLLFADMMEALAYSLSIHWVIRDGIFAPSSTCWVQGWLGSTSNLATSLFLSATSINTFLTIVLGYRLPRWCLYATIGGIWAFVLLVNAAGVLKAEHGTYRTASGESYFMRANVWCWISSEYNNWRLWSHYFWIIVSVVLTLSLYVVVFYVIWIQKRQLRHLPRRRTRYTPEAARRTPEEAPAPAPSPTSDYHPAFLVYPFVYLVCITPLLVGRLCIILGHDLGIPYFAFAGSVSAGNGLFNSALWTSTMLFSAPEAVRAAGLDQFRFLRTPARAYGHTVVISGPASRGCAGAGRAARGGGGQGQQGQQGQQQQQAGAKEWWWWRMGGLRPWGNSWLSAHRRVDPDLVRISSNPPVEGPYIQMDVVTHVVVENVGTQAEIEKA